MIEIFEFFDYYKENKEQINVKRFTGPAHHWITAYNKNAWGLTEDNKDKWKDLDEGDLIIFHSTGSTDDNISIRPTSGIIGLGIVGDKYEKDEPWWFAEFENEEDSWPYVVEFSRLTFFGSVGKIEEKPINLKNPDEIRTEVEAITQNILPLSKIKDEFDYNFPSMGSMSGLREHEEGILRMCDEKMGGGNENPPDFRFTEEFFEKREGDRDDLEGIRDSLHDFRTQFLNNMDSKYYEFYKMCSPSRNPDDKNFDDWHKSGGNPYVSNWQSMGRLRDHLWMGFARCDYSLGDDEDIESLVNPRKRAQMQIYQAPPNVDDYAFFVGLWLQGEGGVPVSKREDYASRIRNNKTEFLEKLPKGSEYKLIARNAKDERAFEKNTDEITKEDVDKFCSYIDEKRYGEEDDEKYRYYIQIGVFMKKEDVIDKGKEIVPHTIRIVKDLTPLYRFACTSHFILGTGSDDYKDIRGKKYSFKKGISTYRQLIKAEIVDFVHYEDGKFYAKGELGRIYESEEGGDEKHYSAEVKSFEEFDEPLELSLPTAKEKFSLNISIGPGMHKISQDGFKKIISATDRGEKMTKNILKKKLKVDLPDKVLDGLFFPNNRDKEIINEISSALNSGKNIIFTGPPGTGKTEIAKKVVEYLSDDEDNPQVTGSQLTTATADWSTFDTVGGYMPSPKQDSELEFKPGHVLRRFKNKKGAKNELLVIDEINRADIDKAFGQLFTVLSGQKVQLPFKEDLRDNSEEIEIIPWKKFKGDRPKHNEYVVPKSWRLLATMNTYDKTSLYEMSYAFMRRFAFIHIGAPDVQEDDTELLERYIGEWPNLDSDDFSNRVKETVVKIWSILNSDDEGERLISRKIGPAIVKDMLEHIKHRKGGNSKKNITNAVISYIVPQLEGLPDHDELIEKLKIENINHEKLGNVSKDILR